MSMRVRIMRVPNPPGSAVPEYRVARLDPTIDPPHFSYASPSNLQFRATAMGASASTLEGLEERAADLNVGEWFDTED